MRSMPGHLICVGFDAAVPAGVPVIVQPDGLEALPADRTYQLWMIEGDEITSAGLLEDPSAAMMNPGAIPEGVVVGLTVEPAGGSDQPTMAPMAQGELT